MFCLHVFLYTMCMPVAKKESEPPEVELQTVVGAENPPGRWASDLNYWAISSDSFPILKTTAKD